nr:MAG TPA: hypothetical protein [Caudoviricetes sp.]
MSTTNTKKFKLFYFRKYFQNKHKKPQAIACGWCNLI